MATGRKLYRLHLKEDAEKMGEADIYSVRDVYGTFVIDLTTDQLHRLYQLVMDLVENGHERASTDG